MTKGRRAYSKLVSLKRIKDGGSGASPPAAGQSFEIFWKKAILMSLDHISDVYRAI